MSRNDLWTVLAVGVAAAATWWAWLGWDSEYQIDPVTGVASGPYEAWQVIGCVLCLAAIAIVGGLLTRPWLAVASMTVTFTAVWSWWAGRSDETGLWLVGAILVFIGLGWSSSLLAFGAWFGRRFLRAHRAPLR